MLLLRKSSYTDCGNLERRNSAQGQNLTNSLPGYTAAVFHAINDLTLAFTKAGAFLTAGDFRIYNVFENVLNRSELSKFARSSGNSLPQLYGISFVSSVFVLPVS